MTQGFLKLAAWFIARLPDSILEGLCRAVAGMILSFSRKRRDVIFSNLDHAFPDASPEQLNAWARISTARMVEMGLLSFCSRAIPEKHIDHRFKMDPAASQVHLQAQASGKPIVVLVPHLSAMEMMPWLPRALPETLDTQISCIYRPLGDKALNAHVLAGRQRFGMRLLSRKGGLNEAIKTLRGNGLVALLFDQNVRDSGIATLFFNRVCSATDLPGLLAQKTGATVLFAYFERTGFWKGTYRARPLEDRWLGSPLHITVGAQHTLETLLTSNPEMIPDWLWSHNRWRGVTQPNKRLHIDHKKDRLRDSAELLGLDGIPKTFRLCLRLPDSIDEVATLLKSIQRIPEHRPDAHLILVGSSAALGVARERGVGEEYYLTEALSELQAKYLDTTITFLSKGTEDRLWAKFHSPQRFAATPEAEDRPGFTHLAEIPAGVHGPEAHKFLLEHFGLPS